MSEIDPPALRHILVEILNTMIYKLSFSNFYSFKNKVSIDFCVDKNAPDTDSYSTDLLENRVSKIMTVIGANASGKTGLLKSLVFLKWFIVDSYSDLAPKDSITNHFHVYQFCKGTDVSNFEVVFGINKNVYKYELQLTNKSVIKEVLKIKNPETKYWNNIFSRELKESESFFINDFSKLEVSSDFDKLANQRSNASVLSIARQVGNVLATEITDFFSKMHSNLETNLGSRKSSHHAIMHAAEFFNANPDFKAKAEKLLRRFDLGVSKISIEEFENPSGNKTKFYLPMMYHRHSDSDIETPLPVFSESGGTQNLFILLKDILVALETGNTVVFDELDNNLHPHMIPEIINLFRSKNDNPKNAQILFSTHNVQILNELDKQQIVLVEKDDKNISNIWKLSDIQGVRPNDNYYAKYMAGFYGAIPKF